MKAITVIEPYASLIIFCGKDIENRSWETPYRGRLAIHAGKSKRFLGSTAQATWDHLRKKHALLPPVPQFGLVLGTIELTGCPRIDQLEGIDDHPWAEGPHCWTLTDPIPLREPFAYLGALGLFEVPDRLFPVE